MSDAVIDNLEIVSTTGAFHQRPSGHLPGRQYFRKAVLAGAVLAHVGALALVLAMSHPLPLQVPAPDQVIELVDMQEYSPPPPEELIPPTASESAPVIPELAIPVKAPVDSPVSSSRIGTPAPVFLSQGQIDEIPIIPSKEVLSRIQYPELAAKMGQEATVLLELYIDQTGKICQITVLKDPGNGFAQAAVKAMNGLTCAPAKISGQPVSVRFRYPVRFTLK